MSRLEMSIEYQLSNLLDSFDPDSKEAGILRQVISDGGDASKLSEKQLWHWDRSIQPVWRRQREAEEKAYGMELMERDD